MKEGVPSFDSFALTSDMGLDATVAEISATADRRIWGLTWIELLERCVYRPNALVGLIAGDSTTGIVSKWIDTASGQFDALFAHMDVADSMLYFEPTESDTSSPWTIARFGGTVINDTLTAFSGRTALENAIAAPLGYTVAAKSLRGILELLLAQCDAFNYRPQFLISQPQSRMFVFFHALAASRPSLHVDDVSALDTSKIFTASLADYP